jgi:hypothetical protein
MITNEQIYSLLKELMQYCEEKGADYRAVYFNFRPPRKAQYIDGSNFAGGEDFIRFQQMGWSDNDINATLNVCQTRRYLHSTGQDQRAIVILQDAGVAFVNNYENQQKSAGHISIASNGDGARISVGSVDNSTINNISITNQMEIFDKIKELLANNKSVLQDFITVESAIKEQDKSKLFDRWSNFLTNSASIATIVQYIPTLKQVIGSILGI